MSTQQTPFMERVPFIPPEIFLNIMEISIAEAEELQTCIIWDLCHSRKAPSTLYVRSYYAGLADDLVCAAMKERFRNIRLILHISRATRAMAHRTFINVPRGAQNRNWNFGALRTRVNALVLPKLDYFNLLYPDYELDALDMDWSQYLQRAMRQLGAESHALLERIEHIILDDIPRFDPSDGTTRAAALSLPNIKCVWVGVGGIYVDDLEMTQHDREWFVDQTILGIAEWELRTGISDSDRYEFWAPLLEKGVKVYAYVRDHSTPLIEILITKTNVSCKYLDQKPSGGEDEKEDEA